MITKKITALILVVVMTFGIVMAMPVNALAEEQQEEQPHEMPASLYEMPDNSGIKPMSLIKEPPIINSASALTPSLSAPGIFKLNLGITEAVGVGYITVTLEYELSNGQLVNKTLLWRAGIEGNFQPLTTGIHTLELTLDETFPAVEYNIVSIVLIDMLDNHAIYQRGATIINQDPGRMYEHEGTRSFPFNGAVTITSSPTNDITPPVLNNVELLTSSISVPGLLELSMDITEDGGVDHIGLGIIFTLSNGAPGGKNVYWESGGSKQPLKSGVHTVEFELDETYPIVNYTIAAISMYDTAGNQVYYYRGFEIYGENPDRMYDSYIRYGEGKYSIPFIGEFEVTDSPISDITPPKINSATILNKSPGAPGIIRVEMDIEEDTGVVLIGFSAVQTLANGKIFPKYFAWHTYDGIKQPFTTGVHIIDFPVDPTFASGTYEILSIGLIDVIGNEVMYVIGEESLGEDTRMMYDRFGRGQPDNYSFEFDGIIEVLNSLNIDLYAANGIAGLASQIANMPDGSVAVIDYGMSSMAANSTIAAASLFSAIAGKDKTIIFINDAFQWVFNGMDIKPENIKDINLSVHVRNLPGAYYGYSDEEMVTVISFGGNGILPGKAEIRVYTEYMLARHGITMGPIFFTLMDDDEALSDTLPAEIEGDNYITFEIERNSTYVLSTTFPDNSINIPPSLADMNLIRFIESLYQNIQGRKSDTGGMAFWLAGLKNGSHTGASTSGFFFFSPEYIGRGRTDVEFINDLYNTCMGRDADDGGMEYWLSQMAQGASRKLVLNSFLNGTEFRDRCAEFGVTLGRYEEIYEYADMGLGITTFVFRCYEILLGREAEREGLNNWAWHIIANRMPPTDVARHFVFSDEFVDKGLSNEEFLDILYRGIMDRAPDQSGYDHWMSVLVANPGEAGRHAVFNGFAQSDEWRGIVATFGL